MADTNGFDLRFFKTLVRVKSDWMSSPRVVMGWEGEMSNEISLLEFSKFTFQVNTKPREKQLYFIYDMA